jgi:hypothetical protein
MVKAGMGLGNNLERIVNEPVHLSEFGPEGILKETVTEPVGELPHCMVNWLPLLPTSVPFETE